MIKKKEYKLEDSTRLWSGFSFNLSLVCSTERLPTVAHKEEERVARCCQQHLLQKLCFINLPEPIIISG